MIKRPRLCYNIDAYMEHKDYTVIHAGTAVTREILDRLGSPDDALKIIHIAGTNGKGSTAEFFTRILIAAGKRVGTFTSPAVYDFYDQFRIDGVPYVAEKYFEEAHAISSDLQPTDFEIQTAGIINAFYKEGCEWAVIECGLGGLSDATNAINKKELAVITSISSEHTEYLGNTIEEICAQKAGIIKDCPAVIGFQPSDIAEKYFKAIGGIFADGKDNSSTAIKGAEILGLPEEAIEKGIKTAKLSGRVEKISACGRQYILDGAHNPAAFEPLISAIKDLTGVTVIFGCLKDKDIDGILSALGKAHIQKFIAVPCPNPRTRSAEEVKKACSKYFSNVEAEESVTGALDKAYTETAVVCGSFTLLKPAKEWIDNSGTLE